MKIRMITKGDEKSFNVSGNPIILETFVGQKKNVYQINQNGNISKIRGKRNLNIIEMLENRQIKKIG
jgi:hypothetical protein